MNTTPPIRLLVADDHKIVLDGLVALLSTETSFHISATAGNGKEALECVRTQTVDICLLDINMPGMDGIETMKVIRDERLACRVIILTTYGEREIISQLLQLGVAGYLLKNATRQELMYAITRVAAGGYYFSDEVQASIALDYAKAEATPPGISLTQREKEVLELLALEFTNDKIADTLHISFRTVETHRKNMMQKTGASNLAGLLRYAFSSGLLK
ncbi:MAG TPA: response regulator transcription factor [Dinghuibacter sp.]|jgi:DNA-binding NarL/FixJ family response regulator|uniref:response regulator transcription factor n=1 Tax=Dinghuibacter sp. TaxID=2024697 RepID=UPI002C29EEF9|nr:response regulator transcription factor [Dinghuibacter sp.]HTJ13540.1 response regulator transcription factor [Dinghuibacter sp.]